MEGSENDTQDGDVITVEQLKEKGNECVKKQDYKNAILHYSEALRRAQIETLHILYSNRSFAYLKNKEYFYALSDASKCIELAPDFVKGYFRKAEVFKEICLYDEAIINYGKALKLEPTNNIIMTHLRTTAAFCSREMMLEKNVPYVGAGCGVIFAIVVIILDQFTKTPTLKNPLLMVFMVMLVAGFGFLVAKLIRNYLKIYRKGLIEPPTQMSPDFLIDDPSSAEQDEDEIPKKRTRYTKSQARFRFKKGKT